MNVIDMSYTISSDTPVYPGTEPPQISIPCTIENNGFEEKKICFYSHTGTHIDAPGHIIKGASTLDQLPMEQFIGKGFVLNYEKPDKKIIELSDIEYFKTDISFCDFLIINCDWAKYWGKEEYFYNFPVLSEEAAKWLVKFNLKGIGFDTISADPTGSVEFEIHHIFLKKGIIIIENLTNLDLLKDKKFTFSCFPLKILNADGSPVRAIALVDD